ncbi:hypothetical protein ACVGVM_13170 [Pseudonocardia bannensis]|uniref:Uncharacterized protein n=1 Tax=Pseudonocardia bannensis TaxID=630973 RepID=A0A848DJC0_9PSEU|nr:hypothetical protein [Pseudonocardia bannensis]NMH92544.1 hypothetical protein [Pseudonocardia bannensis]
MSQADVRVRTVAVETPWSGPPSARDPRAAERLGAEACLEASHLLRRHARRQVHASEPDQQVTYATCHLLEAVSLALTDDSESVPEPIHRAALRLARLIAALPPRGR